MTNLLIKPSSRIDIIDFFRGLMLIIITFNHLDGPLRSIFWQPIGFVSAAEGFIFLSGFVYGLVYTKDYLNNNFYHTFVKSVKRAGVIYFYHILTLIIVLIPVFFSLWEVKALSCFSEFPLYSILSFLTFINQPENMDILPMYIIFILIGPFFLKSLINNQIIPIAIVSLTIWMWGTKISGLLYPSGNACYINPSFFNIFSWQLLFFAGCFLGYQKANKKKLFPVNKFLFIAAIILFILFVISRYQSNDFILFKAIRHFASRENLGFTRLLNFGIITYIIYYLSSQGKSIKIEWISFLGRHSLHVFVFSIILVYFYIPIRPLIHSTFVELMANLLIIALLILPAKIHQFMMQFPGIKKLGI
jgi:hypothetical protein